MTWAQAGKVNTCLCFLLTSFSLFHQLGSEGLPWEEQCSVNSRWETSMSSLPVPIPLGRRQLGQSQELELGSQPSPAESEQCVCRSRHFWLFPAHTCASARAGPAAWRGICSWSQINCEQVSPSCTGSQKHPKMSAWVLPAARMCKEGVGQGCLRATQS